MWRDLRNFVQTIQHYQVMSPDRAIRRQVNQMLRSRPHLPVDDWCQRCWCPPAVSQPITEPLVRFLYTRLGVYSGLDMGCTRPHDRLLEDLKFPLVCWFDWGLMLCEDVYQTFGVDLTDSFDERNYLTLADLAYYLDRQLAASG